jgi:hypothetical protein
MKKLNRTEMDVITQEVQKRVNVLRLKDVKEKSKKDKDCINLIKKYKEIKVLNDKVAQMNKEMATLGQNLSKKYNNKFSFSTNYSNPDELNIQLMSTNVNKYELFNKIVLMGIDKELKVEELIAELVKDYNK